MVWRTSYTPFGGIQSVSVTPGALSAQELRFPGQWFQAGEPDQGSRQGRDPPANGLHQNWMRDYDPTTGRYLQTDPPGLIDGPSVYGYARQSPLRYTDPRGECVGVASVLAPGCVGAVVNVAVNWWLDPDCYTWGEFGRDAAVGFFEDWRSLDPGKHGGPQNMRMVWQRPQERLGSGRSEMTSPRSREQEKHRPGQR